MNSAMLRIKGEAKVYMVPEGLPQLLSDISREVLRSSPRNIYQFVAEYLLTILRVRESVKGAIPTVDSAIEEAAERISFLNRLNITEEVANRAATIIQAAWRGFLVRRRLKNLAFKELGVDADASKSAIDQEKKEAAIKIQSFFRGYYTRLKLAVEGPGYFLKDVQSHDSWSHEWLNKESDAHLPTDTECDQQIEHLDEDLRYALARSVEGGRLRLATVFYGSYENYDLMADSCHDHEAEVNVLQEAIQARSIHSDSERFIPDLSMMEKSSKGSKESKSSKSLKSKVSLGEEVEAPETTKKSSLALLDMVELPEEFDVDISEFQWGAESLAMTEESWTAVDDNDDDDDEESPRGLEEDEAPGQTEEIDQEFTEISRESGEKESGSKTSGPKEEIAESMKEE